jgi:hypothetical protein
MILVRTDHPCLRVGHHIMTQDDAHEADLRLIANSYEVSSLSTVVTSHHLISRININTWRDLIRSLLYLLILRFGLSLDLFNQSSLLLVGRRHLWLSPWWDH